MGAVRLKQCSWFHLQASSNMAPCGKLAALLLLLVDGGLGARTLRGNAARESRNLLGTFPFNAQDGEDHHGATMVTMEKAMVANLFRLLRLVPSVRETTPM